MSRIFLKPVVLALVLAGGLIIIQSGSISSYDHQLGQVEYFGRVGNMVTSLDTIGALPTSQISQYTPATSLFFPVKSGAFKLNIVLMKEKKWKEVEDVEWDTGAWGILLPRSFASDLAITFKENECGTIGSTAAGKPMSGCIAKAVNLMVVKGNKCLSKSGDRCYIFEAPVAFADSEKVHRLLGRKGVMDKLDGIIKSDGITIKVKSSAPPSMSPPPEKPSPIPQPGTKPPTKEAVELYVSGEWASSANRRSGIVYQLKPEVFLVKRRIARNLTSPLDGTCGPNGYVYFVDYGQNKVIRYDPRKDEIEELVRINRPTALNFDSKGNLYLNSARGISKIKMSKGEAVSEPVKITPNFSSGVSIIHGYYRISRNIGGIAFLNKGPFAGSMVAVDTPGSRVLRFDPPDFSSPKYFITSYSKEGKTASLSTPVGIAINSQGNIFVADAEKREILEFDSSGNYITTLPVKLYIPLHLEFDGLDNLYVTQWGLYLGEGRVTKVLPSGDKVRFVTALTDAWGLAVCPRPQI